MDYKDLTTSGKDMAKDYGYMGLFSTVNSMDEGFRNLLKTIQQIVPADQQIHLMTATMLIVNRYAVDMGAAFEAGLPD